MLSHKKFLSALGSSALLLLPTGTFDIPEDIADEALFAKPGVVVMQQHDMISFDGRGVGRILHRALASGSLLY